MTYFNSSVQACHEGVWLGWKEMSFKGKWDLKKNATALQALSCCSSPALSVSLSHLQSKQLRGWDLQKFGCKRMGLSGMYYEGGWSSPPLARCPTAQGFLQEKGGRPGMRQTACQFQLGCQQFSPWQRKSIVKGTQIAQKSRVLLYLDYNLCWTPGQKKWLTAGPQYSS